jgi:hypothetical protein
MLDELPSCSTSFRHADCGHATCYGDPMPEMEPTVFVSFMKIVATLCIIAMVVSVWPGEGE